MRKCKNCSKELDFDTRHTYAEYCGPKCRYAAWSSKNPKAFDRPFLAWDGEGEKGRYTLLANSLGAYIERRKGLSTVACLEFLLSAPKEHNNIWFGFGYDVTMILKADLPFDLHKRLYRFKKVEWNGYSIFYIPRKQFSVRHIRSGRSFNSYDTLGFFQTSFEEVIRKWIGEPPEIISRGKRARETFNTWRMSDIRAYNNEECRLLVTILDKFRQALREANLYPTRFDGAGAIASYWLRRENAKQYYGSWPEEMEYAVRCAYFGGRNDVAALGHTSCNAYDVNSAYPAGMRNVPDLSEISWKKTKSKIISCPFSLVHIKWSFPERKKIYWGPFPWRTKHAQIIYPLEGEGWYYGIEVAGGIKRFGNHRWLSLLEMWEPQISGAICYPLKEPIERDYLLRSQFRQEGNPANVPIKLGLNALYGKQMQKRGFANRPPAFRNYLWGGYITAQTRRWMSDAISCVGDRYVLATATDGIMTLKPLPEEMCDDEELGMWKHEKDIISVDLCGSGLYQTYNDANGIFANKRRGFGAGFIDYPAILQAWRADKIPSVNVRRFIGIGLAGCTNKFRDCLGTFQDLSRQLHSPAHIGTEKRLPARLSIEGLTWLEPCETPMNQGTISYPYIPHSEPDELALEMETIE